MSTRFLIVAVILLCGAPLGLAQDEVVAKVEDAAFVMISDTVIVTYRLLAPEEQWFEVGIRLRVGDDSTFVLAPTSVVGAVGLVQGAGEKVILWDFRKDIPPDFEYREDYWFEVTAKPVERGLRLQWWHYATGGAVIAGVAIAVASGGEQGVPASSSLPYPPTIRPLK